MGKAPNHLARFPTRFTHSLLDYCISGIDSKEKYKARVSWQAFNIARKHHYLVIPVHKGALNIEWVDTGNLQLAPSKERLNDAMPASP